MVVAGLEDVALLEAVDAAFAGTTDITFAAQRICRALSETFDDPVVFRLDDGSGDFELIGVHGPDSSVTHDIIRTARRTPMPMTVMTAINQGHRAPHLVRGPAGGETPAMRSLGNRIKYRCGVAAPLHVGDTLIGTIGIACTNDEHDHAADDTLPVLDVVAQRCADLIDRARLEAVVASSSRPRLLAEGPHAAILGQSSDIVLVVSPSGRVTDASPAITSVLGWDVQEVVNGSLFDLVELEDRLRVGEQLRAAAAAPGPTGQVEFRARHRNGSTRWLEVQGNNLVEDPTVNALVITARDVTERHQAAELVAAENAVLQEIAGDAPLASVLGSVCSMIERRVGAVSSGIWLPDQDGMVSLVAASMHSDPSTAETGRARIERASFSRGDLHDGVVVVDPRSEPAWSGFRDLAVRTGIAGAWTRPIVDLDGKELGLVSVCVTEHRAPTEHEHQVLALASNLSGMAILRDRSSREIAHAAQHDSLTGLPNRARLLAHLDRLLERARGDECVSVLFIDLDDFKIVNDFAGHAVGDRLLQRVAARLSSVIRPMDLIARLGGDEFAVLCHQLGAAEANQVAGRVLEALAQPFDLDGRRFDVSASCGIAVGDGAMTADEVLRDADAAMYEAKRAGRSRSAIFTPAVRHAAMYRLGIEQDLRGALEAGALDVHFQPVVALESGRLLGLEALVRWPHAPHPVPEFIEIAESTGLIGCLGEQVLRSAVARIAAWRASGLVSAEVRMAVNVSARQLVDPTFVELVLSVLAQYEVPGAALCLEVTETAMMSDLEGVSLAMNDLERSGVTFAIDDFGTGHSSLARLRSLAATVLKLDRSFIVDLDEDDSSVQIVANVIGLAHALGKELVIEGVERPSQLHILRRLGADAAQGYHLARPASAEAIEGYLRTLPR